MPEIWQGMLKNDFMDKSSGVRLNLNWRIDGTRDFNTVAKKDGELYNIIKQGGFGLYIDRLQGGIEYFDYTPDIRLCEQYEQLIGDRFLGFQMHEWASNYLGEFKKMYKAGLTEWSESAIIDAYHKLYPQGERLMTESMSVRELYTLCPPSNLHHMLKNLEYLFNARCKKTGGRLITCDSSVLGFDYELKNGARNIMAEIGGQTEDTRLQIAYARGCSKAHGKPFGAYYEPWGGKPLSAVKYTADDRSEWQPQGSLNFAYSQGGENSGSTRSLQRRLHFYSYFAGAGFMSEEWCANTTFYDWNDFELTPYGKVKKEFIDFTKTFDVGKPLTPIAAVLPKDFSFINAIHDNSNYYMNMPVYGADAAAIRTVKRGLCEMFSNACDMKGNEYITRPDGDRFILINSELADAIDIIHEDSKNIGDYRYLVDLTSNPEFAQKYNNIIGIDIVKNILFEQLPCTVTGNVSWTVTQKHFILLINNDGVSFDAEKGEYTDPACDHIVQVTFKNGEQASAVYGEGKMQLIDGSYYVDIPAGGIAVLKF